MSAVRRRYSESSTDNQSKPLERPSKRIATVYDAVAGRVTQAGFIGHSKNKQKSSKQPLRPDEVLFKQSNAPVRYEETDYYYAHNRLPPDQQLPSGDLLSAIHAYVSKLYSRTGAKGSQRAWKCMDETALIAFGILMEETAREVLGDTGDLAFVEGVDEDEASVYQGEDKEKVLESGDSQEQQDVSSPFSNEFSDSSSSDGSSNGSDSDDS